MKHWEYATFYCAGRQTGFDRFVEFPRTGEKWEPLGKDDFSSTVARLGLDGWELVSHVAYGATGGGYGGEELIFKRPLA